VIAGTNLHVEIILFIHFSTTANFHLHDFIHLMKRMSDRLESGGGVHHLPPEHSLVVSHSSNRNSYYISEPDIPPIGTVIKYRSQPFLQ
jgi:hypothetical protein